MEDVAAAYVWLVSSASLIGVIALAAMADEGRRGAGSAARASTWRRNRLSQALAVVSATVVGAALVMAAGQLPQLVSISGAPENYQALASLRGKV